MKKTIRDFELLDKKVIIRCDFNVPFKDGEIQDDTRISESLPTIEYARTHGAKVILLSHLGRVKTTEDLVKNDLSKVAIRLSELLKSQVIFVNKTRGATLEKAISEMKPGDILLIQNTRYEDLEGKKESSNDLELGSYWASLGDIFINDAFGTIHRAHASNVGIASHLPNGIGFLVEKELNALTRLDHPEHPYVVILGGAKVSDKIGVIEKLAEVADQVLIGGGMAFTFLQAKGYAVGKSLVDQENIEFCKRMLEKYPNKIQLPIDVNSAFKFSDQAQDSVVRVNEIPEQSYGMDIGPETVLAWQEILSMAKTIVWNGPLGVYEMPKYRLGTEKILEVLKNLPAHTVLGGGDIVAAASSLGYKDKVSHASTGGGATLEYLEGKTLPGLESIAEK